MSFSVSRSCDISSDRLPGCTGWVRPEEPRRGRRHAFPLVGDDVGAACHLGERGFVVERADDEFTDRGGRRVG